MCLSLTPLIKYSGGWPEVKQCYTAKSKEEENNRCLKAILQQNADTKVLVQQLNIFQAYRQISHRVGPKQNIIARSQSAHVNIDLS